MSDCSSWRINNNNIIDNPVLVYEMTMALFYCVCPPTGRLWWQTQYQCSFMRLSWWVRVKVQVLEWGRWMKWQAVFRHVVEERWTALAVAYQSISGRGEGRMVYIFCQQREGGYNVFVLSTCSVSCQSISGRGEGIPSDFTHSPVVLLNSEHDYW